MEAAPIIEAALARLDCQRKHYGTEPKLRAAIGDGADVFLERCGQIQTDQIVAYFPSPNDVRVLTKGGCTPKVQEDINDFVVS